MIADFGQPVLVRGGNRHAVEDHVHRHAGQRLLLVQRHAELLEGAPQLGVDLVHGIELLLRLRRRVVADVLEVDPRILDVRPGRLGHGEPVPVGLQPKLEQPLRLVLLARDEPDHVLAQPFRHHVRLDVGHEAVLVGLIDQVLQYRAHAALLELVKAISASMRTCEAPTQIPRCADQTLKLSPQPHSLLALGLSNLNDSLRPSRAKSSVEPSRN